MGFSKPQLISGLGEIAPRYDTLICDIWGVLHDGVSPFEGADEALKSFREGGGKVLLMSNAPRPAASVVARLDGIGTARHAYDTVLTSGDLVREEAAARGAAGQACHYIGPDKDSELLAGVALDFADPDAADFILLSGLRDDRTETPDDYAAEIEVWRAHDLPLICANPDRRVQFGKRIIYCAGAVAERYEQAGGNVVWLGKPHAPIYARAAEMLAAMRGDAGAALVVGDGPATDISGAAAAGLDALFITGGLTQQNGDASAEAIAERLARDDTHAAYAMHRLIW